MMESSSKVTSPFSHSTWRNSLIHCNPYLWIPGDLDAQQYFCISKVLLVHHPCWGNSVSPHKSFFSYVSLFTETRNLVCSLLLRWAYCWSSIISTIRARCLVPSSLPSYILRSGAFGRVLSYDGQLLLRSEDVGHCFDPFFIQTPFPQMPCAFGEVGWNIGSPKHLNFDPGQPLPWVHRGQPLFRERRVVEQRVPSPLIQRARTARTCLWNTRRLVLVDAVDGAASLFLLLSFPNFSPILVSVRADALSKVWRESKPWGAYGKEHQLPRHRQLVLWNHTFRLV